MWGSDIGDTCYYDTALRDKYHNSKVIEGLSFNDMNLLVKEILKSPLNREHNITLECLWKRDYN